MTAWRTLRCVRLFPVGLSGLVPWLKGVGKTFSLPSTIEVFPHERRARFSRYPDDDHSGVFENGVVRIERNDGFVVTQNLNHRASFRGLAGNRHWSPIDALYFFGYALTHYHSLPFSLFASQLVKFSPARSRNEPDILTVVLPADLPTHSRHQRFYFDSHGSLTRHDYHAEIVGVWARGLTALHATFANAEVEFDRG